VYRPGRPRPGPRPRQRRRLKEGRRLLGFEPGPYQLETRRKHEFASLRVGGPNSERFRPGPNLMDHIRQLPGRPHARVGCRG
jgi:hypothetical protein